MDLSIALGPGRSDEGRSTRVPQGAGPEGRDGGARTGAPAASRAWPLLGLLLVGAILLVYAASNPERTSPYDHFVRQAEAFLRGRAEILLPAPDDPDAPANGYLQDAMPVLDAAGNPTGEALLPFPPLPALVLLPVVALTGSDANGQWVAVLLAALAVLLALRVARRLPVAEEVRILAAVFLGLGTVLWYAAAIGTTWYLAHVVALVFAFPAVELALREGDERRRIRSVFLAGLLLGLAGTARLPVVLGLPFLLAVEGLPGRRADGAHPFRGWLTRRVLPALVGLAIPLMGLGAYDLVSTGSLVHPAYQWQYEREAWGYPELGYRPDWAIEDPRYLPRNLEILLLEPPVLLPPCDLPGADRGLLDPACPLALPNPIGMSLLLTSPGWLLALAALRRPRPRWAVGAAVATAAVLLFDLMHFSQGWVQFGYRFALDATPFAFPLLVAGIDRLGDRRGVVLSIGLVAASVLVTWWGVGWGVRLGW